MKDIELIKTFIKSYITQKDFKYKINDIKKSLKTSINVNITKIREDFYDDIKVLYIYFGGMRKKCLIFVIKDDKIEHVKYV